MGVEDREWWRQAQRERERREGPQGVSSHPQRLPGLPTLLKWGHAGIVAFWLVVMGIVYVAMDHYLKPNRPVITAQGDLIIPRARDGHFYVDGTVGGKPLRLLVDTGASHVTVSEAFARKAGLERGAPATFNTANGPLQGRLVRAVPVAVGPMSVSGVTMAVGLVGSQADHGLLGQSFLSKFEITISRKELVLRRP